MSETLTDREWLDQLTLALRLRDVSGRAIGEALAEVESHLAESDQSAAESFGDPRLYAAELSFAATEQQAPGGDGRVIASGCAFGVAAMLLVPTAGALLRGETAYAVTWGALLAVLLLATLVTIVARALRWVVDRPVGSTVLLSVGFMSVVVSLALLTGVAFTLPTVVLVVASGAVFITGLWRLWPKAADSDLVTDPVTGGERAPAPGWMRGLTSPWPLVVVVAALIILDWRIGG